MDKKGQLIFDTLVDWSKYPLVKDPFDYIDTTFGNLPAPVHKLRYRQKEAVAKVAMGRFFDAYQQRDWKSVLKMAKIAFLKNPRWFFNRGVMSICMRAIYFASTGK